MNIKLTTKNPKPVENLLSPDTVRRLAWEPPDPLDPATVEAALRGHGARGWQVALTLDSLAEALAGPPAADPVTEPSLPDLQTRAP